MEAKLRRPVVEPAEPPGEAESRPHHRDPVHHPRSRHRSLTLAGSTDEASQAHGGEAAPSGGRAGRAARRGRVETPPPRPGPPPQVSTPLADAHGLDQRKL